MKTHIKTTHQLVLTCLVLMMFSSCNYINNVKLLTDGSLERSDFVDTVPFEYQRGLIIIEAEINDDNEKRQFIFDTGAFDSKIEFTLAEDLKLPTIATKTNSTAQGVSQTIEVTRLERVQLGSTGFSNISAGKLEFDTESASQCLAPHGIIGANLMKLAHWEIDYQQEVIRFSGQPFQPQDDESYPLKFETPLLSGTPEVELQIEDKTVSGVLFDVGFNGGLVLPAWLLEEFPTGQEKIIYDRSTSGIFGSSTDTLVVKDLEISVGGYSMEIPVEFSSIGKALLGNDVLEHFEVTINYDTDQIYLSPQSEVNVESPYSFIPGMLNDSLWVVDRATPELALSLGDTLRSVNGQIPSELYTDFCDYFININKLLDRDSLSITKKDGHNITLTSTNIWP